MRMTRRMLKKACLRHREGFPPVYIETGVWEGTMTMRAADVFETVIGIELDWRNVKVARARLEHFGERVKILHGSSTEILPGVLEQYADVPVFFYLDAHFCKLPVPIEKSPFPLWDELQIIRKRQMPDVVAVDDVHTFGKNRDDLRFADGAKEWESVKPRAIRRALGRRRVLDSDVIGDAFVCWMR